VIIDLQATPASIVMSVQYPLGAPADAVGTVRLGIKVKVKNWTATDLNLKRWGVLNYKAASGAEAHIPQFPFKAFSLKPKEQKVFQHYLDLPANYTEADLYFDVGPDPGSPWEVYSEAFGFIYSPSAPVAAQNE
jgi:hypothetical protein